MNDISELIRLERLAFVDFLDSLTADEWATASLCSAWTVQDVAAHLAWTPTLAMVEATLRLGRAGFSVNKFIADSAVDWSRRGTAAILDQLRANAASGAKPLGVPREAVLADAVIHPLDIRVPLVKPRPVAQPAFEHTAAFFLGISSRWPLSIPVGGSPKKRVAGVRLVAADLDWSHGTGPEVHGSSQTLLLLLAGRPLNANALTGPGVGDLRTGPELRRP